ncbi:MULTISPECIES: flagellar export chaperone FliS [Paenibacillus]|uniref:flagellar export chaperone FliS n=1 Tax=Paenibacillus TaxID=44249 RepID=UPI000CF85EE8|nr:MULTISPECIES: flagellar export chaperone FliS [Paenibacillus]MEC0174666.1 flagellar export chaperone FliS [Paenibacillus favisporus]PQP87302.1 flagellar export chaperone FliS [Paenibacillus sp. AR247]
MITSPYEKYRQSSVQTSTPGQLLLMLYDGAIRFVRAGIDSLQKKDLQKANLNLGKSQSIVNELLSTLDRSYAVSEGLASLYEYINHLLIESNVKKTAAPAEEALGYLMDLRETFAEAAKMTAGSLSQETANG